MIAAASLVRIRDHGSPATTAAISASTRAAACFRQFAAGGDDLAGLPDRQPQRLHGRPQFREAVFQVGDVDHERAGGRFRLMAEGGVLPDRELIDHGGAVGTGPAAGTAGDACREGVGRVDRVQRQPSLQVEDGAELFGSDPGVAGHDPVGQGTARGPAPTTGPRTARLTPFEHVTDSSFGYRQSIQTDAFGSDSPPSVKLARPDPLRAQVRSSSSSEPMSGLSVK